MAMESYPCPKCHKYRLCYDGMLVWRRGEPRPSRKLARKQRRPPPKLAGKREWLFTSLRADHHRSSLYHCDNCRAEFSYDMGQGSIHLYEEGVSGKYTYDEVAKSWQFESFAEAVTALKRLDRAIHSPKAQPQVQPKKKRESKPRPRNKRTETLTLILFVGGFVVLVAGLTALILMWLGQEGVKRGALLGAGIGLLEAILNGPRPKSRRGDLPMGTIFAHILLLALAVVPGGAVLGALVGGIHSWLASGSIVVRVIGYGVSGAVLGGCAALLTIQVGSATAAAIGTLRGHWKRHALVEMADSAKGVWYEGGVFWTFPGLFIGTITGIILALIGTGGSST